MNHPDTVVLDISSDDDDDNEDVSWGGSTRGLSDGDDHNWLTDLLDEVDKETDDSDDVVVVSEVVVNPKNRFKTAPSLKGLADDDDDCVILDADPDEPVAVKKDGDDNGVDDDGGDSDELVVVSEKGQVACRDYPHPRHLCAQFSFSSTPHEKHCHQCHCYVCDSLAPCVHWGAGSSSTDHCHATEKDEFWKIQRKSMRTGGKLFVPALIAADASITIRPPQNNEMPLPPLPVQPSVWPVGSNLGPTTLRACSMSTNFPCPNPLSQSRSHPHGYSVPTNKFQRNLVSQQMVSSYNNNANRRDRRHDSASGYLGPQVPREAFKRTLSTGVAFKNNRCSYNSSRVPHGSHNPRFPQAMVNTSNRNPNRLQEYHGGVPSGPDMYMGPSQPLMGNVFDSAPSHDLRHFRPQLPPHPTADTSSDNPTPSEPGANGETASVMSVPSQLQIPPLTNFTMPPESQVYYPMPPCPPAYHVPLAPPAYHVPLPPPTYQMPSPSCSPTYPVPCQPQVGTHPNYIIPSEPQFSSAFGNPTPSEPQICTQSVPDSNYCHSINEQKLQTHTSEDTDFQDFNFNWMSPSRESGQQSGTNNLPAEGVPPISEVALVGDQRLGKDFQYDDSWMFDSQPVEPGSFDVAASSGLNGLSPEPGIIDGGIFFDY